MFEIGREIGNELKEFKRRFWKVSFKDKKAKSKKESNSKAVEVPTLAGAVDGLDKVSRKGAKAEDDESKPRRPLPQPKAVKPNGAGFVRISPKFRKLS